MILISIGANLPSTAEQPPLETCRNIPDAIKRTCRLTLVATSRWYETSPVPPSGQRNFINGIARFTGEIDPAHLLEQLHALETRAGRVRSVANAARPLDLDIVAINDLVRNGRPILPHPRAHERRFVLRPLIDVAPEWIHPTLCKSAIELLEQLTSDELCRPVFTTVRQSLD
jgi:2-amino-4-hydroxy-6-hydroxymethyldihydropteridine diphosphokinase